MLASTLNVFYLKGIFIKKYSMQYVHFKFSALILQYIYYNLHILLLKYCYSFLFLSTFSGRTKAI